MFPLPLGWILVGFVAGYITGSRHRRADALRREASAVLDSVGRLSGAGALSSIADLQVHSGNAKDGVQVAITTVDGSRYGGKGY
jgi:hypothetical protein